MRAASSSTVSVNEEWSIFWMKAMTSPDSPQPKQWKVPSCGRMWKEGLRSSWNGHSPLKEPMPADLSVT